MRRTIELEWLPIEELGSGVERLPAGVTLGVFAGGNPGADQRSGLHPGSGQPGNLEESPTVKQQLPFYRCALPLPSRQWLHRTNSMPTSSRLPYRISESRPSRGEGPSLQRRGTRSIQSISRSVLPASPARGGADVGSDLYESIDQGFEVLLRVIEMRSDPKGAAIPDVDNDLSFHQLLPDLFGLGHVKAQDSGPLVPRFRRNDLEASRLDLLSEAKLKRAT